VLVATLGTGIGTALFHGGRLLPNTEFGHMQMGAREAEQWAAGAVRIREKLDWPEFGQRVSLFLQEMDRLVSPDLIVLGGGVSENFAQFQPYLRASCPISNAQLGNNAGLIGAALAVGLLTP
jgi:polyphosphate glucokinase